MEVMAAIHFLNERCRVDTVPRVDRKSVRVREREREREKERERVGILVEVLNGILSLSHV